jgi:hypothetical protein
VARRPETVHFDTYNPSVAADQMQDLATVVAWALAQPDVREVSLIAEDASGAQALLARPLLHGLARTMIELDDLPDPTGTGAVPAALDLPGLHQFGGFLTAATLSAPAPLWIIGASSSSIAPWARPAYSLAGADHVLRIDRIKPTPRQIARWIDGGGS